MKKINITYLLFYCAFAIVVFIAIFLDKWLLVYSKPIVPMSLIVLYLVHVKKVNLLFPLSMLVIAITDIFNYIDFIRYYDSIALLISSFYVLCIFLLRDYIVKDDIKLNRIVSLPVVVSTILITYLIYTITELALPKVGNSLGSVAIIVISVLLFVAVSFFIYVADRYEKSIYLFIAACCTLFVDALLAINELYYYTRVFTILINIAEIAGLYFFTSFFIETKNRDMELKEEVYF